MHRVAALHFFYTLTQCLVSFEGVQPPSGLRDSRFCRLTVLDDYSLWKYGKELHTYICVDVRSWGHTPLGLHTYIACTYMVPSW